MFNEKVLQNSNNHQLFSNKVHFLAILSSIAHHHHHFFISVIIIVDHKRFEKMNHFFSHSNRCCFLVCCVVGTIRTLYQKNYLPRKKNNRGTMYNNRKKIFPMILFSIISSFFGNDEIAS